MASAVSVEHPDEGDLNAIGVFARLRPGAESPRDKSIVVRRRFDQQRDVQVRNLEFSLDFVFDTDASQEEVYEVVAEQRVALVQHGYSVCLLAYGQTGSGKTHTIYGPDTVLDDWQKSNPEMHGLAPRAVRDFFEGVARAPTESQFIVRPLGIEMKTVRPSVGLSSARSSLPTDRSLCRTVRCTTTPSTTC